MSGDYIPSTEGDFKPWVQQFRKGLKTNAQALGLSQAQVDAVDAAVTQWLADEQAHEDAKAALAAAAKKNAKSHDELEQVIRSTVHVINGHPDVDNAMRALVYLPPHDEARTPIGAPTTKPLLRTDVRGHYTLLLHVADEATPLRTAKPHGVHGYRIYRFIGDPAPADPAGFTYLTTASRTPYADVFNPADAGKSVHYLLCWESTRHQTGPWSDVVSTKIPA